MPKTDLNALFEATRQDLQDCAKIDIQDALDDLIYDIFKAISLEVEKTLCFGPANSKAAEKMKALYYPKMAFLPEDRPLDAEAKKVYAAIVSSLKWYRSPPATQSLFTQNKNLIDYFLTGFISGTGTCEVFALFTAIVLSRDYDVPMSIVNMHSEQVHTVLQIHTSPSYFIDCWAGCVIREDDWISWNETYDNCYLYTTAARFRPLFEQISQQSLDMLAGLMKTQHYIYARQAHLDSIFSDLDTSEPCRLEQDNQPAIKVS